jgi:predicted transcriptional regulator
MTDIILSIHPKWAEKIYTGEKTVEVRKTRPTNWLSFPTVFVYETAPIKKITGLFKLDWIYPIILGVDEMTCYAESLIENTCLTNEELTKYADGKEIKFWIPKGINKFDTPRDIKGSIPQSWRYLKEGERYD